MELPKADVDRIGRLMRDSRVLLRQSMGHSVASAMRFILASLGASTKVSQKLRTYRDTGQKSRSGMNKRFEVWTRYRTPRRRGKATRASYHNSFTWQTIWAKNVSELKRRPALRITMRGVAKASFGQASRKGNFSFPKSAMVPGVDGRVKRIMLKAAHRWVTIAKHLKGENAWFRVDNSLRHIMSALRNGPKDVTDAYRRAGDAMEIAIAKRLEKKGWTR